MFDNIYLITKLFDNGRPHYVEIKDFITPKYTKQKKSLELEYF